MNATNYVSTWMYVESPGEGGLYPQVGGLTTSQATQNIYWRCVYTFFWSASQFLTSKEQVKLLLFTNVARLPVVDGVDLNSALAAFNVEIVTLRYTWAPSGKRRPWFNQYFLFDILDYCARRLGGGDTLLVMDNDCLIVRDLGAAFDRVRQDGALLMTVGIDEDEDANGLSRRQAIAVYRHAGGEAPDDPPPYYGGEFYGLSGALLPRVVALAKEVRVRNDALAAAGQLYFSDEAHFFSYLMWRLGLRTANANALVRRIWTTWKHNDTGPDDLGRAVWHLPSEKTYGFADLFARLAHQALPLGDPDRTRAWLAKTMGVGRKSLRKFLGHFTRAAQRRLKRRA